ncbi:hypothetical protein C7I55_25880 [Sphingomonas deserti]|uniref:Uncharacterized protein n=1 Tax=Allosphingosinicella deserti TaxID=2116704 RepID=A0A2P7QEZ2_9SPHN|nr:hypothetical protein C7I55_25880 [Sphingomonas deserti]
MCKGAGFIANVLTMLGARTVRDPLDGSARPNHAIARALRVAVLLVVLTCAAGPEPLFADVINLPPDTCETGGPIGDVEFSTEYRPRKGEDCAESLPRRAVLLNAHAEWQPRDVPVLVQMVRNRRGYVIFLASMLEDRHYRQACWTEHLVSSGSSGRQLWSALNRRFRSWVANCPPLRTAAQGEAERLFAGQRESFTRALTRMAALSHEFARLDDYRTTSTGSFLPRTVSQNLLDAVADTCGLPRDRVRLRPDGRIAWSYDGRQPFGQDGSRPAETCVEMQIRYLPGFLKP